MLLPVHVRNIFPAEDSIMLATANNFLKLHEFFVLIQPKVNWVNTRNTEKKEWTNVKAKTRIQEKTLLKRVEVMQTFSIDPDNSTTCTRAYFYLHILTRLLATSLDDDGKSSRTNTTNRQIQTGKQWIKRTNRSTDKS